MPILTKAQKGRTETKARAALMRLLSCKERKDMLESAEIFLGRDERDRWLYLTQKGLMVQAASLCTGEDAKRNRYHVDPSLELVQGYNLSAPELKRILRELRQDGDKDEESER